MVMQLPTYDPLRGTQMGLNAIAQGQSDAIARQDAQTRQTLGNVAAQRQQFQLEEDQLKAAEKKNAKQIATDAMEAWKAQDYQTYKNKIRELTVADQKAAEGLNSMFGTLSKQNFGEASHNVLAATLLDSPEAQNQLIQNAIEDLEVDSTHPFVIQLQRIKGMPPGRERNVALLSAVEFSKKLGMFGDPNVQRQKTGAFTIVNPATGETRIVAGSYNPANGEMELTGADIPEGFELASKEGETPEAQTKRRVQEAGEKKVAEQAVAKSGEFAGQYEKVQTSIRTLDEAISEVGKAIEEGKFLGTGPIEKYIPKWTESSARFKNIANRMGLDVISSVTFGALSEAELKMAMETAVPTNLDDKQMLTWLKDKKAAQQKLSDYFAEAAAFIGAPKEGGGVNTVQDWIAKKEGIKGGSTSEVPLTDMSTSDLINSF